MKVLALLEKHGAMFTSDLEQESGLLRPQLEQALKTLIAAGAITSDAFSPLRWLLRPEAQKLRRSRQAKRHAINLPVGRWSITGAGFANQATGGLSNSGQHRMAVICQSLLRRYGVVFRAVIQRETLLPPWRVAGSCPAKHRSGARRLLWPIQAPDGTARPQPGGARPLPREGR